MYDAEGSFDGLPCPDCGSRETITYHYREGFEELECRACGFRSDREELSELGRYRGELRERTGADKPLLPLKPLEA